MTYTGTGEGVTFLNRYYGGLTDDDVYRDGGRVTFLNRYYGGLTGDDVYRDGEGWPFSIDIMEVWRVMTYTGTGGRVTFLNRYYGGLTDDDVYRDGGKGDLSQ